jgi:hypothetical protein
VFAENVHAADAPAEPLNPFIKHLSNVKLCDVVELMPPMTRFENEKLFLLERVKPGLPEYTALSFVLFVM